MKHTIKSEPGRGDLEKTYERQEHPALTALAAFGQPRSHPDTAIALGFASRHPGDVAPQLLLWLYARLDRYDQLACAIVWERLCSFVARNQIEVTRRARLIAALDGMTLVYRRRRKELPVRKDGKTRPKQWVVESIKARGKELKLDEHVFATLRHYVEDFLRRTINGALKRFFIACGYWHVPGDAYALGSHQTIQELKSIAHMIPDADQLQLDYEYNRERIAELNVSSFTRAGAVQFTADVSELARMLRAEIEQDKPESEEKP